MMQLSDFERENFMEICFKNKDNVYAEGPGAGLEKNKSLMICLKNVPKGMDNEALKNILSNYGDILRVTQMNDVFNPLRFAECKDETSLEAVLRGMSTNEWNIQVSQKTEKKVEASISEKSLDFCSHSSKGISEELLKSDINNLIYPSLTILKYLEYSNQSKESSFFQNRRISDHVYNIGKCSTNSIRCDSRYQFSNLFGEKYQNFQGARNLEICVCFVCQKYAVSFCEQCKEFYCSKECQNADWPTHKFTCTEKLQLIRLQRSKMTCDPYKNLRIENEIENKIRCGASVVITHVEKSNCVFIRSIEENDHADYVRIINTIASFGAVAKNISNLPVPGDIVLAQYNFEWFRAVVLNSNRDKEILLAYPDIGCTVLKAMPELREFPADLKNLKRLTYCVYLEQVQNAVLNKRAEKFLYSIIEDNVTLKIEQVFKKNNDLFSVELKAIDTNQNINKKLNILINPTKPSIHDIPIFLNDVEIRKFKPCCGAKVIVLDNSFIELGFISCILNNDAEELDKINTQIAAYAQSDIDFYTPREGEICLVKGSDTPNTWYRGVCEVVSGDGKPILTLLDFGSIYNISINNIRKCPQQLNLPCFTNQCYIKGLQTMAKQKKISNLDKTKLQDIIKLHALLTIPEIEVVEGEIFITLPEEIVNAIKDYGIFE
ncbi:protein vreteno-like [Condylostylus longicornis]|uniref:protein vreteno-like n=1 Tax=Condylostylus longicornis TaxID=2530218 RepID=UPI00244DEEEF|nr:protein vreteno-like [Condylostylus longicornis]